MKRNKWASFTAEEIKELANDSLNIKDFCVKLGYSPNNTHRKEILKEISDFY